MATRVLVIDDRPQDRFLARRALAAEFDDLDLTEIRDQQELDDALAHGAADVIVTDYQLRWTDGLQVLAAVRGKDLDVPVVMFTHTGSEEVAAAGLRAGLADYIIKTPTHYRRLGHAVRIAMQNAAAARNERTARAREREALRTAEEALRLKDEFLATLSHELRTPLNAISGWLQIIRRSQPDPARIERGLVAIERNTALLTRLIADLVDVSRIVTGTLTLHVRPTDVRPVVEAALDSVRPAAQAKQLEIEIEDRLGLEPVAADPDRLQQIVWNLLSNAVKFTPAGGRITIGLAPADSMIEISVADTGPGIRPEFLSHAFERFSQQDAGMTREYGGMGLGLAIVRHLSEMHGGSAAVVSAIGEGARFTVRIPVATEQTPKQVAATANEPRLQLSGIHVLVVDDDADAREIAGRMLEDEGAAVTTARSAAEAYDMLAHGRPDVLVCDLGMPDEDGLAFIARVRSHGDPAVAAIPALAVTAYAGDPDRARALHAGFHAHLPKPVDAGDLVARVRHLAQVNDTAAADRQPR